MNQDVASKHWGCTHFEDRHGVVIRTKVSCKLVKMCQALSSELKLTGHFNDIFCGPAIMSSSSVMACITVKQVNNNLSRRAKNLTVLLDLVSTSEVISSEVLN